MKHTVTGRGSGSVTLNQSGEATITYRLTATDSFTLRAIYAAPGNYQAAPPVSVFFTVK